MKKWMSLFLTGMMMLSMMGCGGTKAASPSIEEINKREVCESAVLKCYYHNVEPCEEKDVKGFLAWKKDKKYWLEFDAVVTLGIDASKVGIEVSGTKVTVTIPQAKILSCESQNILEPYYDKGSVEESNAGKQKTMEAGIQKMMERIQNDQDLLDSAQARAKELLENYIKNIGSMAGVDYTVEWKELNEA